MGKNAPYRFIKDPLRPYVVQERIELDDPWSDMAAFEFEGDALRALDSHQRKYGPSYFRMRPKNARPPKRNPKRAKAKAKAKRNPLFGKRKRKGKRQVLIAKRAPDKVSYQIVGRTDNGSVKWFTGTGFGHNNSIVMTFPNQAAATKRLHSLKGHLPKAIRIAYVERA